ncbi:membrane protein [Streptomyces violarus]|uniref:Peptidoglycan/LPS O-acetylase OafA/YrhL n=1 Tax=Streptomyces violarus TaxID=67380 RepID=A0A7W4ZRU5_9ACTN|nr:MULTISPECIES: acyltransferase family protein [Streptomyces]MBB3077503.1 peptidoglycan/LPS O-acetylase OafA/YrhL [Streptomyces violarus]WRU00877.1 acyltransferase family protein [Streptomyces sp. CGMCC 4.1772]GHD15911.1 membrane protein [Streptomyces violarus]
MTTHPDVAAAAPEKERTATRGPVRDRYFDLLRALALFRVVLYHLTGWAWLPLVFPSMGVMFALAGNLMARSLKRPPVQVIRGRLRRLLPPLWLLGVVGVTGMVLQGWGPDADGHPGWWWLHLTFWIVPLSDPPYAEGLPGVHGFIGEDWAAELAGPLWYIRAYLWYVLLSPLLLKALRALPVVTLLAPIALAVAFEQSYLALPGERFPSALTDFSTFGACWILGMAHQEGILKRLPRYIVPSVAPVIALAGLWYALHHGFGPGNDLDSMPLAQALWSLGTVFLLLHVSPSWSEWPPRLRRWSGPITLLNSRAVTIYLWHNICILVAATLWDRLWAVTVLEQNVPGLLESPWPVLVLVWVLIGGCVLAFGWMEDLAAKQKPRLWPKSEPRVRVRGSRRRAVSGG